MSVLTKIAATPHVYTSKRGKAYTLRLVNDDVMGEWENKRLAKAREFEAQMKPMLTREEFMERLDRLSKRHGDGEFSLRFWFIKHAAQLKDVATPEIAEGFLLLTALIFNCPEDEAILLMRENKDEVAKLVGLVLNESMEEKDVEASNGKAHSPNA